METKKLAHLYYFSDSQTDQRVTSREKSQETRTGDIAEGSDKNAEFETELPKDQEEEINCFTLWICFKQKKNSDRYLDFVVIAYLLYIANDKMF